jgi:hypothetical protein
MVPVPGSPGHGADALLLPVAAPTPDPTAGGTASPKAFGLATSTFALRIIDEEAVPGPGRRRVQVCIA